jgi:uncharacterized protein YggE
MKQFILVPAILMSQILFSQKENQAIVTNENPFIEVTGTSEKEVVPDKIFVSITLKDKTINKQQYSITQQEEKLKKALLDIKIDVKNLSLTASSKKLVMYKRQKIGVEEKRDFILLVSNTTQINKLFETLNAININEAFISRVDHTQIENLRKEVRIAAIQAAKEKATYLLAAIGEKPSKPLVITELNNPIFYSTNYISNSIVANSSMNTEQAENDNINFEKMVITFSYTIKYGIE